MNAPRKHSRLVTTTSNALPAAAASETQFTGADGTVSFGPMSSISFQGRNPWTFEIWVYLDALLDTMNLISRAGEFVMQTQNGAISVSRTNQVNPLVTGQILQPNSWYYIVAAFDGTTLTLYVDGDQVAQMTLNDAGIAPTGSNMTVGGGFYGQVDSARFWDIYLAPGAIFADQYVDYASGTQGLVAQIDFTQSPPVDTSGNNTPVTVSATDVSLVAFTPALSLTEAGSALPYADTSVNPGGSQQSFTIMAWVAPAYRGVAQNIFCNGTTSSIGTVLGITSNGNLNFQVGNSSGMMSTAQLSAGSWTNVAATWSASTGATTLYVNGVADANTGTIPSAGTLAAGAPLIGASVTSTGPSYNFIGSIQSVAVFNAALSQSSIQTYQTADPINSSACTACYDFSLPFPQNEITGNPVGLIGSAELATVMTTLSTVGPDLVAPRPQLLSGEPAGAPVSGLRPEHYSSEARQELVDDFRRFLTEQLGLSPEQQERYAQRFAENLDRGAADIAAGTYRAPFTLETRRNPDGTVTLVMHTSEGSAVVYTGQLTDCQIWQVSFIIAILGALLSVLGFAKFTTLGQRAINYIATLMGRIGTRIKNIFVSGTGPSNPTVTKIFDTLKALWSAGALTPLLKFCWEALTLSLSPWTVFRVCTRLALFFSPWAAAEIALMLAELGYAIYNVIAVWNQPQNCWVNNEEQRALRVA